MDAYELMIGDWVMVAHDGNAAHYAKVTALLTSGAIECDLDGCGVLCKSVDPIPLTQEILEKNGWAHYEDDKESFHGKDCVFISQKEGGYGVCIDKVRTISGTIHYVHELQHALRLCGIKKEVVL